MSHKSVCTSMRVLDRGPLFINHQCLLPSYFRVMYRDNLEPLKKGNTAPSFKQCYLN